MSSIRHLVDADRWLLSQGSTVWGDLDGIKSVHFQRQLSKESRRHVIERAIDAEVIPRLQSAHPAFSELVTRDRRADARREKKPKPDDVSKFVQLLLDRTGRASFDHVDAVRAKGCSVETIFLDLLTPAARLLGEFWETDVCDFAYVTIATSRLQQILRELSGEFEGQKPARDARALVVALPGEQHTFGAAMVQEFLRRDGWQVTIEHPATALDLIDAAKSQPFRLIGLSVSCDTPTDDLAALVKALRRATIDSRCRILVGGRFFLKHPELVKQVGADATASDGRLAACQLSSLLDTKPVRS